MRWPKFSIWISQQIPNLRFAACVVIYAAIWAVLGWYWTRDD